MATELGRPLHLVMAGKAGRSSVTRSGADEFLVDWVSDSRQYLVMLAQELGVRDATVAIGGPNPARSLCDEAERIGASMIVVGNRRAQGAGRVLGSVASDVTKLAPCDVLVVHTAAAASTNAPPSGFGIASAALFEGCTPKERRAIDELATPIEVSAGQELTREGRIGREFGVLLDGTATVSAGGEPIATLSAGDHFGEMALLGDPSAGGAERTATVVADQDMWISMMSVAEFNTLVATYPDIAARLRRAADRRSGPS